LVDQKYPKDKSIAIVIPVPLTFSAKFLELEIGSKLLFLILVIKRQEYPTVKLKAKSVKILHPHPL